jgi:uncharacterized FlgJ-related protein
MVFLILFTLAGLGVPFQIARAENPAFPAARPPQVEIGPGSIREYLQRGQLPKYIRIELNGYNVRKTPDFSSAKTDNIDFQTTRGALFAVSEIRPLRDGFAVRVFVDGEDRWVFVPSHREREFRFCETETCLSDYARILESLSRDGVTTANLAECGFRIGPDGNVLSDSSPRTFPQTVAVPSPRPRAEVLGLDRRIPAPRPVVPGTGAGNCVQDTRNAQRPDFRLFRSSAQRKRAFINYMTPFALEVQATTGLPASVIIAQSALETGWGTSSVFRNTQNLFGHSCWRQGSRRTYRIEIQGQTQAVVGRCDRPRPASAGGYFLSFSSPQQSVYAYASNLLSARHRHYDQVRGAVRRARPNVADWRSVVDGLSMYDAPNPQYRSQVRSLIERNGLTSLHGRRLCR